MKIRCKKCGYEWIPRKPKEEIRKCPNCYKINRTKDLFVEVEEKPKK